MKEKSRYKTAQNWLIFWTLFIGIGAVAGAWGMLADPSGVAMGMDKMLPYFQKLPFADVLFRDLTFSGYALLVVNGLTNLTAAVLLFLKKPAGVVMGAVFGITLMLWICIQFYMFPLNFMSTIYFFFGLGQAISGYAAWVFRQQESFSVCEQDYPHIGTNPKRLVVYFSRMGYTQKLALEEAERTGAVVCRIHATERTEGSLGFLWSGRFGMHRWAMPIEAIPVDLSSFDHVTICSAIWVFSLSAPIRTFCREAHGQIRKASLITDHFTKGSYLNTRAEAESLLGITLDEYHSYICRFGRIWKKTI